MGMPKQRNSSFELMRVIAQYMIVFYHILLVFFYNECENPEVAFKVMWIPLHVAVPCYVLISGYFGIRFNLKSLFRIIAILLVYGLGLYLSNYLFFDGRLEMRKVLFFVSNTSKWFIRIYLYLFLLAPPINKVIRGLTPTNRFVILGFMAWISCWCGFMNFESSLSEGKNLVHFIFLYLLGNTLAEYKEELNRIATWKVVLLWLTVNFLSIIGGYYALAKTSPNIELFNLFFSYNSMILVFNAVLFFMLFMRWHFQSGFVNYVATSSLSIYMLHMFLLRHFGANVISMIQGKIVGITMQTLAVAGLTIVVLLASIIIDKLLSPCWMLSARVADRLNNTRIGQLITQYNAI